MVSSWNVAALLLALLAVQLTSYVQAHGGIMHPWDWTDPEHENFTRALVGSCRNFSFYDANNTINIPGPLPFFKWANKPMKVHGFITIWTYLDEQCRVTSALQPTLTFQTSDGKPVARKKISGYGMVGGTCADGLPDIYRGNLRFGVYRTNMLWWARENTETNDVGYLWGTAPNNILVRTPEEDPETGLTSIMLLSQDYPLMCCDVKHLKFDKKAWAKKAKTCKPRPGGASARDITGRRL